jgi:hypothetical protein
LIVDELGYLQLEPDAAHLFFQLVSRSYETSTMRSLRTVALPSGAQCLPIQRVSRRRFSIPAPQPYDNNSSRQLPPVVSAEYHFDEHRTSTTDLKLLAVGKGQSPIDCRSTPCAFIHRKAAESFFALTREPKDSMAGQSLLGFTVVQGIVLEEAAYLQDLTSSQRHQFEQRLASRHHAGDHGVREERRKPRRRRRNQAFAHFV